MSAEKIYFAPVAALLGDLIVSLPPLQELIQSHIEVCLIKRSPAQEGLCRRIPGLASSIKENEFLEKSDLGTYKLINLRDHPLQTEADWGSAEFIQKHPQFDIKDLIAKICADFDIADGQAQPRPLRFFKRSESEGKILLIPGTASPIKKWPSHLWLRLYSQLAGFGLTALLLGEAQVNSQVEELRGLGLPWLHTPTVADALDAISSAAGVVAVDTGLMHLAVHQEVKTVGLFRENSIFRRDYPWTRNLVAGGCSTLCKMAEAELKPSRQIFCTIPDQNQATQRWNQLACVLPARESCMSLLSVNAVLEAMAENGMLSSGS